MDLILIKIILSLLFTNKKETKYFCEKPKYNVVSKVDSNDNKKTEKSTKEEKPIGKIRIPKINLDNNLYDIDSKLNTTEKNIQVLKSSDMPNVENGNLILASHSGEASISYFKNLDKLEINDEIIVNYNNINYNYKVSNIYEVAKTGKIGIKRDKNKKTLTLITCKGDFKQLVVICYLDKI